MAKRNGIKVVGLLKKSPLYRAGLRIDDIITTVNSEEIEDDLDFSFYTSTDFFELVILRNNEELGLEVERDYGEFLDVEFEQAPIRRCGNNCLFCFVDQLPEGLRDHLYIKDEDYRHSFLYGNYVTLSTLSDLEMDKIIRLGMSPMYISVHATDEKVRVNMLNNRRAGEILDQLTEFEENGISFHTQIVVCPGINDDEILKKSILDLLQFSDGLLSIAIVPVGITKHQKSSLKPVSKNGAIEVCNLIQKWSDTDKKKIGIRKIFVADEYLIKAELPIPENDYYEDYAQIENGVGLVRTLLDEWEDLRVDIDKDLSNLKSNDNKFLIATSQSAARFLQEIINDINSIIGDKVFEICPVENQIFGPSVTVAGLLCAKDVIESVKDKMENMTGLIIPAIMLNYELKTLDEEGVVSMSKKLGKPLFVAENIKDLIDKVVNFGE